MIQREIAKENKSGVYFYPMEIIKIYLTVITHLFIFFLRK